MTKYPDALNTRAIDNDIEGQLNFVPAENHSASVGGNFHWAHISSTAIGGDQGFTFRNGSANEYLAGLFAIDRWKATDKLTVEGQIRGDWYSETQLDWSGRLTTLYTLNEERKRILRFSAAKAFRAPLMTQREGQKHAGTHYAGGYWFNIIAPDDLKNEETWSLEAGYSEQLASWLTFRTDFYYQRFERLIGDKNLTDTTWPYNRTLETLDNLGGADSYGCEVEFKAKAKAGEFSLWYALNEFQQSRNNTQVDAYLPAPHKAGATARLYLPYDSVLNMNYRFTSATSGKDADLTIYTNPCVSHRFDISLAKKLGSSNGELMLGVSDLFNRTNDPVEDTWKHPTPGRTFFVRLQLKF
ncbi:MAG: TonB-dependent receptor [Planctomycetes bacterium]|nr:TonB-dependent receptor [Planctomycetota bacterium]